MNTEDDDASTDPVGDEFRRLAAVPGNVMAWSESETLDTEGQTIIVHSHFTAPGTAAGSVDPNLSPDDLDMEIQP